MVQSKTPFTMELFVLEDSEQFFENSGAGRFSVLERHGLYSTDIRRVTYRTLKAVDVV